MIDAFELGFDIARAGNITIGEMTEVELDGGLKAPFEWYLVDCDRALAAIHGGGEMPRCVEVCGVVGREPDPLAQPSRSGKSSSRKPGKNLTTSAAVCRWVK